MKRATVIGFGWGAAAIAIAVVGIGAAAIGAGQRAWAAEATDPSTQPADLKVTVVGRPTADKQPAARKLNELFLYQGRLYIGHGDYGVNTGRTDVIAYDPATNTFTTEFTTDDEAIVTFRQLGDKLVIPGVDATEDWQFGNVYVRGPGPADKWEKRRTVPGGVHVLDVAEYRGQWYAAAGIVVDVGAPATKPAAGGGAGGGAADSLACGAVFASADEGRTWRVQYTTASAAGDVARVGGLAVWNDLLLATPYAFRVVPAGQVPAGLKGALRRPIGTGADEGYLLHHGSLHGAEAVLFDGRGWRTAELTPVGDPRVVQVIPFGPSLVVAVTSGPAVPSTRHLDLRKDGLPKGVKQTLWATTGTRARPLRVEFDALKDHTVRDGRLTLLVLRGGRYFVVTTADLFEWTWHRLPESEAEPLSVEAVGEAYYVGTSDGTLLKATR